MNQYHFCVGFYNVLEVIIFGHGLLSICIKLSKLYAAIYCLHGSVLLFCLNFLISKFMKWNWLYGTATVIDIKICLNCAILYWNLQVLGDEEKRTRYDRGEDIEDMGMGGGGGGGFNPFGGGGQQFTFHFEGGFPGGFNFWLRWSMAICHLICPERRVVSCSCLLEVSPIAYWPTADRYMEANMICYTCKACYMKIVFPCESFDWRNTNLGCCMSWSKEIYESLFSHIIC